MLNGERHFEGLFFEKHIDEQACNWWGLRYELFQSLWSRLAVESQRERRGEIEEAGIYFRQLVEEIASFNVGSKDV